MSGLFYVGMGMAFSALGCVIALPGNVGALMALAVGMVLMATCKREAK